MKNSNKKIGERLFAPLLLCNFPITFPVCMPLLPGASSVGNLPFYEFAIEYIQFFKNTHCCRVISTERQVKESAWAGYLQNEVERIAA